LLLLNRLVPLDQGGVEVVGDVKVFEHWLEHSAF
jgi:hypothetical protein